MTYDLERIRADFDRLAAFPPGRHDHNARYYPWLLRHVPGRCGRALDVGCGHGVLTRLLARRCALVDAIDVSPAMVAAATGARPAANVRCEVADFLAWRGSRPYDLIVAVASLHHVPLAEALRHAVGLLAPGGVLLILDLVDGTVLPEWPRSAVAWVVDRWLRLRHRESELPGSTAAWAAHGRGERVSSFRTIKATFAEVLPEARVRRHLFWRYSAVWQARTGARS